MQDSDVLSGLIQEMRRGTIVLSVLLRLKTPMYGYSLIGDLADAGITVEANTLYPLLRRLEAQGLLKSEWETSGAKPRKYYTTTPQGEAVGLKLKAHWDAVVDGINSIWEDVRDE